MSNKIANVVLVRDFPTKTSGFDYLLPTNKTFKVGQLCLANFRGNINLGVIIELKNSSEYKTLKTIIPLEKDIVFNPAWIKTIIWFSKFYHYSVGSTLKLFFPVFGKKFNLNFVETKPLTTSFKKPESFAKIILRTSKKVNKLIFHANKQKTINNYYIYLAFTYQQLNKNILIICPDQQAIKNITSVLSDYLLINLDASLTQRQWRENWLQTLTPGFKIIVSTQKGCLTPINNLGLIIVDQENSSGHIQRERNPRYDCRIIAKHYAESLNLPLVLTTLSPSLYCLALAQQKEVDYYSVKLSQRKPFVIVDQTTEIVASKNMFGPICETAIKTNIINKKPTFIFSFYHQSNRSYCFYCDKESPAESLTCLTCKQPLRTDKKSLPGINSELQKLGLNATSADNYSKDNKIYVGGLKHLNNTINPGLTIIINADNILNIPNFQSAEKLRNLIDRVNSSSDKTIILSKNVNHHCYADNYMTFAKNEMAIRKKYNQQPYGSVFHIVAKTFNDQEIETFSQMLNENYPDEKIEISQQLKDKANKNCYLIIKVASANPVANISDFMYSKWMLDRYPADLLK